MRCTILKGFICNVVTYDNEKQNLSENNKIRVNDIKVHFCCGKLD